MPATIYFVTALTNSVSVKSRLEGMIPEADRYELRPDQWMVSYDGPAQDLAENVGVRGGENVLGNGLVLPVTTYSGRAPTTLWDWLRQHGV